MELVIRVQNILVDSTNLIINFGDPKNRNFSAYTAKGLGVQIAYELRARHLEKATIKTNGYAKVYDLKTLESTLHYENVNYEVK